MDIKDRINARRLELGFTLEDIGKKVGVSKSTVRKWETGYIENMKRDKIALLANALEVTPTYLMGWQEDEPEDHSKDFFGINNEGEYFDWVTPEQYKKITAELKQLDSEDIDKVISYAKYLASEKNKKADDHNGQKD